MSGALRKKLQEVAQFAVVVTCTVAFLYTALSICVGLLGKDSAGTRDFVEYWASGQQLAHHANPYDAAAILPIERSAGFPTGIATMVMGNAPTMLLLVAPLGYLGPRSAEAVWMLLILASLIISVRMVRAMHGSPDNLLHYLGYAFGPVLACIAAGQVALFVLLGYVLFLRYHASIPLLAGAALWLCALKPQLFLPFGLVLLAWVVTTRSYRILLGAAGALGLSAALAYVLDPQAWMQYHQMMAASRYDKIPIPCLSIVFRRAISPDTMWLQYVPAAIACLWALAYFRKHRADWDWMQHGSPLILVSVVAAPYTWLLDQCVLIPALLHGAYGTRSRIPIASLALASAAIQIATLRGVALLHSVFYIWTAPLWLIWYLVSTRLAPKDIPAGNCQTA